MEAPWSFQTPSYELDIDHGRDMSSVDQCSAVYCVDVTTSAGSGDAFVSWYWDGDGYCAQPHWPCSDDGYTPEGMSECDQMIYPPEKLANYQAENECSACDQLIEETVGFHQSMLLGPRQDMDDIANAVGKIYEHRRKLAAAR